jgi:hypothetical protein
MMVAEAALYVAIACAERRKIENRTIMFTSDSPCVSIVRFTNPSPLTPASGVEEVVRRDLRAISDVQFVDIEQNAGEYVVNIGVSRPPKYLRYAIYAKQMSLIETFPEHIFDFRLVEAA